MKLENQQQSSVSLQRRALSKALWAAPLITSISLPVHAQCSSPPCAVTTVPPNPTPTLAPFICPTELITTSTIQGYIYTQDLVGGTTITENMEQAMVVTNISNENLVINISATEVVAGPGTSTITPSQNNFTLAPGEAITVTLTNILSDAELCFAVPGGVGVRTLLHSVFVAAQSDSCQQELTLPSGVVYSGRCRQP